MESIKKGKNNEIENSEEEVLRDTW